MKEFAAQNVATLWVALCVAAVLTLLIFLMLRGRKREPKAARSPVVARVAELTEAAPALDQVALTSALHEAEERGEKERLPALYLSLARCRSGEGKLSDAEDLLRKS